MFVSFHLVIGLTPRHQPSMGCTSTISQFPVYEVIIAAELCTLPECHSFNKAGTSSSAKPCLCVSRNIPLMSWSVSHLPVLPLSSPAWLFYLIVPPLVLVCLLLLLPYGSSHFMDLPLLPPLPPQLQPRAPSPDTIDEFSLNPKQAYKAFAAVPHSLAMLEPPLQVGRLPRPCTGSQQACCGGRLHRLVVPPPPH